ncbi:peptidase S8 [Actinorhabdospora filicis]|uniref:Peptidase S8 n=1 Tax=Actinorhabdospora filicis TaxID=1785913 RepID=A0A9W6SGU6_9ACTN|nr:S8 family serine peptidase [Actinorhabdospora filicis]GLZ75750.1 peptidase S8 [Actinorhabdospora filicis]
MIAAASALAVLSGVIAAFTLSGAPAQAADKIEPSVRADLADDGTATFFLKLDDGADLSAAWTKPTDDARATWTFDELRHHAETTQASLKSILDARGAAYESFWIANTIKVTGDASLADALAGRPEVTGLLSERVAPLEEPTSTQDADASSAPQPGITQIGADKVWSQYGATGKGIVIANIDSGVQYDHPSLIGNYRGNKGGGNFDHAYNWYDPTGTCVTAPCDNNGHGTHTMGTMAGADGYGVAPGATWIAAKGCEARSCSDTSLLRAGQWILAPTDLAGKNPRPDLAPDIVNNSWGGGRGNTWYQKIIDSWRAAGIFPAFAAGNFGYGKCGTVDSPGDNQSAYTVGAVDATGTVANFSGLGPSSIATGKPDITAPGVDVVSTVPGSGYAKMSGTSMATPHLAGAVALLWSASPALAGDLKATAEALNNGATDKDDRRCGGDAAFNGVYGNGLLNIAKAVQDAPRGNAGVVSGTVTDKTTGKPIPMAAVTATGPQTRATATDAAGHFTLSLVAGDYTVAAKLYGYGDASARVTVTAGGTATADLPMAPAPSQKVTGIARDARGRAVPGATVELKGTPLPAVTTDATGRYTFPKVAQGAYTADLTAPEPALCYGGSTTPVTVDGDETADLNVPWRADALGWHCEDTRPDWADTRETLTLSGDEDATTVTLPFPVTVHGRTYATVNVTTNGTVNLLAPRLGDYQNVPLGDVRQPNGLLAPFWDDLTVDGRASVRTATLGQTGHRRFVIEWRDVRLSGTRDRVSFQVVLAETGGVTFQYRGLSGDAERGASATVGIEDAGGVTATQYSFELPVLRDGTAITFGK